MKYFHCETFIQLYKSQIHKQSKNGRTNRGTNIEMSVTRLLKKNPKPQQQELKGEILIVNNRMMKCILT